MLFFKFSAFLYSFITSRNLWTLKEKINSNKGYKRRLVLLLYEKELSNLNSWIGFDTKFKSIPIFPHGILGIFISRQAVIGDNCVIFHQVTIGSNTLIDSNVGSPVIGDNVYIGAGAKIIGNVKVGDNCRIGANCVVYSDMPPNSVAVNSPTKIITKDKPLDNRFFTLREDDQKRLKWFYFSNEQWIQYDKEF